jgi:integrating conjugative element protein (TIGR03765 family)
MMRRLALFLLLAATMPTFASPLVVLHDSGETRPLAPLLEASGFTFDGEADEIPPDPAPVPPSTEQVLDEHLQARSPNLSPGVQPRIAVGGSGTHLPRPIFLVGADARSLDWLARHRIRLSALGAVGLVVDAEGLGDILQLRRAAGELQLAAGSGEMLAEHFGLRHYPVLIGPEWIEQ